MSTYRPRGEQVWRLEEQADGTFDVYQGRRRLRAEMDYVPALRFIRPRLGADHIVKHVEPDGYETDITRTVTRGSR